MVNVIIDGNNYIMIAMSVASKNGDLNMTGNILSSMVNKLKRTFSSSSMYFVCFDSKGGTSFRKELNPDYKANRSYDPEKISILESVKDIFESSGFYNMTLDSCEADDAIYALCKTLKEYSSDNVNYVVSRDQDMIQIAQAGYADHIWDPSKKKDMDIPEYSIIAMKALTGDSSDNISGIQGVGPKTALKIISGQKQLTEEQTAIFESNKKIIDAKLNPNFKENCENMTINLRRIMN